jgi:hypothetical protein
MTRLELYDAVVLALDDPDLVDQIVPTLNAGLKEIAARIPLPDLETQDDIYVGTATITEDTISFAKTTNIITDTGKAFITSGFHVGQTITISGASVVANNQTTTITAMATDGSTMTVAGTLDTEAKGADVTIVNDGPAFVPLPSDFMLGKLRGIFRAYSVTTCLHPVLYTSVRKLMAQFSVPDLAGQVVGVATRGSRLYYQRIPSTPEQLTIHYFRNPEEMDADSDTPDGIPEHLHSKLLVNYALSELWDLVEDATEGAKANANYYEKKYEAALAELLAFVGPEDEDSPEIVDEMRWDEMME